MEIRVAPLLSGLGLPAALYCGVPSASGTANEQGGAEEAPSLSIVALSPRPPGLRGSRCEVGLLQAPDGRVAPLSAGLGLEGSPQPQRPHGSP